MDVLDEISEQVEMEQVTPAPSNEQPMEPMEPMEQPMEQQVEQQVEQPMEQLEPPTPAKRVRKVRVAKETAPQHTKETAPQHTPDPDYWRSRLQEHRGNQRAAKSERYGNLRIM